MSKRLFGPNGKRLPLVNEKREINQKRPKLADMMALPKKFKPVNHTEISGPSDGAQVYTTFEPVHVDDNPSKDEIIRTIGEAYPELVSFIKDVDELKKEYAEACEVIRRMFQGVMGKNAQPDKGVIEDLEDFRARSGRAHDVLRTIAYNVTPEKAVEIARKFIDQEASRVQKPGNEQA
jgi:hypothetical protein